MAPEDMGLLHRHPKLRFCTNKELEGGGTFIKYPGTGLKGPVGEWAQHRLKLVTGPWSTKSGRGEEATAAGLTFIRFGCFNPSLSWLQNLLDVELLGGRTELEAGERPSIDLHVILACGFEQIAPALEARGRVSKLTSEGDMGRSTRKLDPSKYDVLTGSIQGGGDRIFGTGIGWPQHERDPEGHSDAWVGFPRSVNQVATQVWEQFLLRARQDKHNQFHIDS